MSENSNIIAGEYLTTNGMAKEFGIAKSTQAKYRKELGMPFIKIGGNIYYKLSAIKIWFDQHATHENN